jgi:7-cyano-7-deazaguanine synthase
MRKPTAICLISGGMDSCVSAAIAASQGQELAFLHISYGQRTQERERQAFEALADYYDVAYRRIVLLDYLGHLGGSALTDLSIAVPKADLHRHDIPLSYVPFRNANMLAVAVSWAEVMGVQDIFIGAVEEDGSGYPDCREKFFQVFNQLIREGTRPETNLVIQTPLIHLNKAEIVRKGLQLGAPLHLTWSCYSESAVACGECDSCALRLRAFAQAGVADPIVYRSPSSGRN